MFKVVFELIPKLTTGKRGQPTAWILTMRQSWKRWETTVVVHVHVVMVLIWCCW